MNTWLVNTNSNSNNGNPNGFKVMLRQNKAAAYYGKKGEIDKINPNDLVLLYHNQNRVIAVGFAIEKPEHDFGDMEKVEHWVDVNWLWKAAFDKNYEPINPIIRTNIGITMVNGTVINVSNQIDHTALLSEIASKQTFL
jgi:predicted Mrr-cat superfamily restriction endonuclease